MTGVTAKPDEVRDRLVKGWEDKQATLRLIEEARIARALAEEGIELVEEGLARSRAKRVSAS